MSERTFQRPTFREMMRRLREAFTCPECGKSRLLVNTAPRLGVRTARPEAFDPHRHCACSVKVAHE